MLHFAKVSLVSTHYFAGSSDFRVPDDNDNDDDDDNMGDESY